jgi:putative ABC transport system substrate-binding protein
MSLRRREFIVGLGGAAAAWPRVARAQQQAVPVVGFLDAADPEPTAHYAAAFRKGLSETGFVEGRNLIIETRFARNVNDRLAGLAADLVRSRVRVLATSSLQAALAAKEASATTQCHRNVKSPARVIDEAFEKSSVRSVPWRRTSLSAARI